MTLSGSWTKLDMPSLPEDHRLQSLLTPLLNRRLAASPRPDFQDSPYWNESFFALSQCRLFRDASDEQRQTILNDCNQQILEEAYSIEKAGMAYTAKMSLLSESLEERMVYSLFGADEATHFQGIKLFLPSPVSEVEQPFLSFLSQLIDRGEKPALLFTIQVILEGWGLTHYRKLADNCQNPELQSMLKMILRDEASHHGSGLILTDNQDWTRATESEVTETLTSFLNMVRCGPLGIVSAFERALGDLSKSQKRVLLAELKSEEQSAQRLELLKGLMKGRDKLINQLTKRDCFRPMRPEESV
ncbi:MAG: ferritin-like domain-containing protein [Planctomycetota bacterium]|nr:ferritin-like domain-containing protein [Planctomycetota bacterium]